VGGHPDAGRARRTPVRRPGPVAEIDPAFLLHRDGKIEVRPTVQVRDRQALSLAYTPGVARVSEAIAARPELAWD
jgi:malate dehydrogenase (oxaloacetate-decarboxylating)